MIPLPKKPEERLQLAIQAYLEGPKTPARRICARFGVGYNIFRNRLWDYPPAQKGRGLHRCALNAAQDSALVKFIKYFDHLNCPSQLAMIERAALQMINLTRPPEKQLRKIGEDWVKMWLRRHPDLHNRRRKPLSIPRRIRHNPKTLRRHFDLFRQQQQQYNIQRVDTWTFDKTGYRLGIAKADYAVCTSPHRRVFSGCPDHGESATSMEAISAAGDHTAPTIIMAGYDIYSNWFSNDLDDETLVAISESGHLEDWIPRMD